MNHIETCYDEGASLVSSHNHDTTIYSEAASDAKFFRSTNTTMDADLLDGSHASTILAAALPYGAIMPWNGSEYSIPSGWVLCDGFDGAPDLQDRFIVGVGDEVSALGETGGSTTAYMSGYMSFAATTLTSSNFPSHNHTCEDMAPNRANSVSVGGYSAAPNGTSTRTLSSVGGGQGHTHPDTAVTSGSFSIVPEYYCLVFIMKVS
jgi:hypothetical protein